MKKGLLFTSVTAFILLTSCAEYSTNLPKKYKEFIDYAYGTDGYTVIKNYSSKETGQREWYVKFSDKNGSVHVVQLLSTKYENSNGKDYYDNQETLDMVSVNNMYKEAVSISAGYDVYEQIISKDIECRSIGERFFSGDGFTVTLLFESVVDASDKRTFDDIEKRISGMDCLKVTDADGRTVGSKKEYILRFNMRIYDESKKDELLEKAETIISDYEEYVGDPQNYNFSVWLMDENGAFMETLAERYLFFGEDFDIEAKRAEVGDEYYSLNSAIADALYGE